MDKVEEIAGKQACALIAAEPTNSHEFWRTVADFPDYEVSWGGDVRRATPAANSWPGRMLAKILDADGYYRAHLHRDGKAKSVPIHRLVCIAFHGEQPTVEHCCVGHYNGIRTDNRASNLRWVTYQENSDDMRVHGTVLRGDRSPARKTPSNMARGSKNGNSRASEEQAIAIKRMTGTHAEIARAIGVSRYLVAHIRTGRTWRHLG